VFLTNYFLPLPSGVACYNNTFGLSLRCNRLFWPRGFHTFFATSRTKCFQLPTRHRSDFLGVVSFSCEVLSTHNSSVSCDPSKLQLPTQPKLQSVLILLRCKQLHKTPNFISEETSLNVHFSCEMVTSAAFTINSPAFLSIDLLCFAFAGVACLALSERPRSYRKPVNATNTCV